MPNKEKISLVAQELFKNETIKTLLDKSFDKKFYFQRMLYEEVKKRNLTSIIEKLFPFYERDKRVSVQSLWKINEQEEIELEEVLHTDLTLEQIVKFNLEKIKASAGGEENIECIEEVTAYTEHSDQYQINNTEKYYEITVKDVNKLNFAHTMGTIKEKLKINNYVGIYVVLKKARTQLAILQQINEQHQNIEAINQQIINMTAVGLNHQNPFISGAINEQLQKIEEAHQQLALLEQELKQIENLTEINEELNKLEQVYNDDNRETELWKREQQILKLEQINEKLTQLTTISILTPDTYDILNPNGYMLENNKLLLKLNYLTNKCYISEQAVLINNELIKHLPTITNPTNQEEIELKAIRKDIEETVIERIKKTETESRQLAIFNHKNIFWYGKDTDICLLEQIKPIVEIETKAFCDEETKDFEKQSMELRKKISTCEGLESGGSEQKEQLKRDLETLQRQKIASNKLLQLEICEEIINLGLNVEKEQCLTSKVYDETSQSTCDELSQAATSEMRMIETAEAGVGFEIPCYLSRPTCSTFEETRLETHTQKKFKSEEVNAEVEEQAKVENNPKPVKSRPWNYPFS